MLKIEIVVILFTDNTLCTYYDSEILNQSFLTLLYMTSVLRMGQCNFFANTPYDSVEKSWKVGLCHLY